jgi:hypothetical protein
MVTQRGMDTRIKTVPRLLANTDEMQRRRMYRRKDQQEHRPGGEGRF